MSNPPLPPMPPPAPPQGYSQPPGGYPPPPPRSWWGRNWKWVVPVGCLTPIVVCGGLITLLIGIGLGAIKAADPYKVSLARAQADAQVQAAIGTPIEPAYFVTGQIDLNNDAGNANLQYSVSGPKGAGAIVVQGTKSAGVWTYTTMEFRDESGNLVDLLDNVEE